MLEGMQLSVAVRDLLKDNGIDALPNDPIQSDWIVWGIADALPDDNPIKQRLHHNGKYIPEMPSIMADLQALGLCRFDRETNRYLVLRTRHRNSAR